MKQKRVSKAQWLEKGLELLEHEGIGAVRIGRIARDLGTSRSGFYWHFKDRPQLQREMLDYWAHEYTEVISENPEMAEGSAKDRLGRIMEMILAHGLNRYDLAIRAWADMDPLVAKRYRKVVQARFDFIGALFAELGFTGDELEMRTRLFVAYHSWESTMFPSASKKALHKLIPLRLELLTRK